MRKVVRSCSRGKFIGRLGLPGMIWQLPIFNFFWLFWLLGLIEIALDFSIFIQNLKLVAGMIIVPLKYGKDIPNKDNMQSDIEFSLPFSGAWVVINGGVVKKISHSWDLPTQRYAYDFIKLDENANSFTGNFKAATSYHCYGKEVLSPADGIVVEILSNQPDSIISVKGVADCTAKDIRGNYIIIKHAEDLYTILAHLKKDSICVKEGEHIFRGQRIALCGNSGNSSEPHLHFQVQTGISFFFSAGVPIRFSGIESEQFQNYSNYDTRPTYQDVLCPAFISRGQLVVNK